MCVWAFSSLSAHLELFTHLARQPLAHILADERVLKLNAKRFKLPNVLARRIPKLFTFLDWFATPSAFYWLFYWLVQTPSDIRHMFLFWSTFQWWILSLWLCPLATKHQPAPWVIVCGYNSVGCDQYVTESGMSTHEQHPLSHYKFFTQTDYLLCLFYKPYGYFISPCCALLNPGAWEPNGK